MTHSLVSKRYDAVRLRAGNKGFTNEELEQCISSYVDLSLWMVNPSGTKVNSFLLLLKAKKADGQRLVDLVGR